MAKNVKIGNVVLKSNAVLAPMAGFTEVGFRSLAKKFGAGLTTTEMISVKALLYKNEKTIKMLETAKNERPVAVQLFGHDPNDFKKVVSSGVLDNFDIIDINMGCPAPKIVDNGDGSALMKNIDLAEKIIRACVANSNKPVTVKFRAGFDDKNINAVEFAKMCERAGASAITVHGRTREQYYSGKADYEIIKKCAKAVSIPVFANGDINTPDDFYNVINITGASGCAIGRGSLGNPQIFAEINNKKVQNCSKNSKKCEKFNKSLCDFAVNGNICNNNKINEYEKLQNEDNDNKNIRKYIKTDKYLQILYIYKMLKDFGHNENFLLGQLRAHLVHFVKGYPLSAQTKLYLLTIDNTKDLLKALKKFFNDNETRIG